jgi:putative heme-binding domain-containing protein
MEQDKQDEQDRVWIVSSSDPQSAAGRSARTAAFLAAVLALTISTGATQQQHAGSVTPAEIEAGARLYNAQCAACHGGTGNQVAGVDLGRGAFRSASSDEALARVITEGVPGTAMRAHRFSPQELSVLIAYVRSMANAPATPAAASLHGGNAGVGKMIVEGKGQCLTCHRINGSGSRRAANLSDIGTTRSPEVINSALANPIATVLPDRRFVRAVTRDGKVLTGRRLNEDTFTVQLLDDQDRLVSLVKSEIREYSVSRELPAPVHTTPLTDGERRDVLSYLISLKGIDPVPARGGRP